MAGTDNASPLIRLFVRHPNAANLLAAFVTHRLVKYTPLRRIAPGWKSWDMGWKFPMGLSLAGTLAIYLGLGAVYGA